MGWSIESGHCFTRNCREEKPLKVYHGLELNIKSITFEFQQLSFKKYTHYYYY